jgi:hypothetical protein
VALAVPLLSLLPAAGAVAQPAPPGIPSVPGSETARFQVIVEGTVEATTSETVGGTNPGCDAFMRATYSERATYRRGRGL